jgi:hypothetical protein
LQVDQALPGVSFFGFGRGVRGGQLRTHPGQLGAVLAGLGLPMLGLGPRGGQLAGQLLDLTGAASGVVLGGLGPLARCLHCLALTGQLLGQLGPRGRQVCDIP